MPREANGASYPFEEMETSQELMEQIEQASDLQINEFISAIMRRYKKLYPGWEVVFLSLPTDPHMRCEAIENMIRFIRSCYIQPDSNKI